MRAKARFLYFLLLIFFLQTVLVSVATAATRIMPLGDSITRGIVGSSDEVGYRRALYLSLTGAGYNVDFVGSQFDGIPSDFDRDHEGHGGWRDDEVAGMVYDWLTVNPADIVLLHIGTNGLDSSPDDVERILDEIDRHEADNNTEITVVLVRIINRSEYSATTTFFNDNVEDMAYSRVNYNNDPAYPDKIIFGAEVDMEDGANIDYHLNPTGDMWDDLHPFATGYNKMANVWFSALEQILPAADAGSNQSVDEGVKTTLDGSNSNDPRFNPISSYFWEQTGGKSVTISDPAVVQPTFTAPDVGSQGETLSFRLAVTYSDSFESTDTTTVMVNGHSSSSGGSGCFIVTITE